MRRKRNLEGRTAILRTSCVVSATRPRSSLRLARARMRWSSKGFPVTAATVRTLELIDAGSVEPRTVDLLKARKKADLWRQCFELVTFHCGGKNEHMSMLKPLHCCEFTTRTIKKLQVCEKSDFHRKRGQLVAGNCLHKTLLVLEGMNKDLRTF